MNIPATPSLSVTLDALWTRTTVRFRHDLDTDRFSLDGVSHPAQLARVSACLDRLRRISGCVLRAEVESRNNFPTGAGLASSASGFAALVTAACGALNLELPAQHRSRLARTSSASAARSVYGGFVELQAGDGPDPAAHPVLPENDWPLHVVVAVTSTAAKSTGSTAGMTRSAATSDFYRAWVESAAGDFSAARQAVLTRDFDRLADIAQASCLKMHGVMLSSKPALVYWNAATVEVIHRVQQLRDSGVAVFFTIDAGPQVKAVCLPDHAKQVERALGEIPGVADIIHSRLGRGARVISGRD